MKISIVIATFNAASCLGNCLESIVSQTHWPLQVVVQDGLSMDGTYEILMHYSEILAGRLDWASELDNGIADAWNKALRRCTGDWVLFLGADDILYAPNTLESAMKCLSKIPDEYTIVYGRVKLGDFRGNPVASLGRDWSLCSQRFRECLEFIPHQATFHRRRIFDEYGEFDPSIMISCDYDFLLRVLRDCDAIYIDGLIVAKMSMGGLSTSRRYAFRVTIERILLYLRYCGRIPSPRLLWNAVKAFLITILYKIGGDKLAADCTNVYRVRLRGKNPLCL